MPAVGAAHIAFYRKRGNAHDTRKAPPGDTIAVFSPSSPATATAAARYRRGKEYLEAKGFRFLRVL